MSYIFKQQFNITDLVAPAGKIPHVVIAEPDVYLARLAEVHLVGAGFAVHHCRDDRQLREILAQIVPAALLLNPESYPDLTQAAAAIAGISGRFPGLIIVTIAHNLGAEGLKGLMAAGIASHINRQLSRPRDVADIIKTLIAK